MILVGAGDDGPGLLGLVAYVMAIFSWVTIVLTGQHNRGMRDFCTYYLRWRVRALTYIALLTDHYPPFGDADYSSTVKIAEPSGERDRLGVGLRLLLVIPHIIALFFLLLAWLIVTVFAWFTILFTGKYPAPLLPFAISVLRYMTRVEAYLLLLVDEYPPFTLD